MRSSLFWDVMQRRLEISYRRFGTTCRPHLQGSSSLLGLLHPWRWGRQVVSKRRLLFINHA